LLICSPFARRGEPGTDQTEIIVSLGVDDNQQPSTERLADENEAILGL
jgi:hypothetical protein